MASTTFTKQNLHTDGEYVFYAPTGVFSYQTNEFVARFKHDRSSQKSFMTFLRKNFTVEEYFGQIESGKSPLDIVKSKGYLLTHIKKWLRRDGYPTTIEGYRAWQKASRR